VPLVMMGSFLSTLERVGVGVATGGLSEVARVAAKPAASVAKAVVAAPVDLVKAVGGATGTVVTDVFRGTTGLVGTAFGGASQLVTATGGAAGTVIHAQGDAVADVFQGAGQAVGALRPQPAAAAGGPLGLAGVGGLLGGEPLTSSTPFLLAMVAAGAVLLIALAHKKTPAAPLVGPVVHA